MQLSRVLSRDGADAQTLRRIYVEVIQVVLLYGSETWVLTPLISGIMGGLYHRGAQSLTVPQLRRGRDDGRVYPPLAKAMSGCRVTVG